MTPRPAASTPRGSVRIIGGEWRGRRLPVPISGKVRPSADRVRETLFNWLSPRLRGARCLDLFAGTGVLGFEALSRGARHVTLIEQDADTIALLRENQARLKAERAEILRYDALAWLSSQTPAPFDIVFIDPPFDTPLAAQALQGLAEAWVAVDGVVYVESAAACPMPPGWSTLRQGRTQQAVYALVVPPPAQIEID